MHASIKELIDLRDGAPVAAAVAQHARICGRCSSALAQVTRLRTQLRRLPGLQPPPYGWRAVEQRLRLPLEPATAGVRLRAAAAVAGALWVFALLWSAGHGPVPWTARSADAGSAAEAGAAVPSLVARSQQLEAVLRGMPRPALERAATSAAIAQLQTRIQVLDLQLASAQENDSSHQQAQRLWSERVQLLDSLVSVRYAEQAARGDYWPVMATGDI